MPTIRLAVGSNLGDRVFHLRSAVGRLAPLVRVERLSAVYESAPMYVTDQPPFLNMALAGTTELAPRDLLVLLKGLESALGRAPGTRFGPRCIDLDILFYDDAVIDLPDLVIPHPRLAERAFVLKPLTDIDAGLHHPVLKRTIGELMAAVGGTDTIRRIDPQPF